MIHHTVYTVGHSTQSVERFLGLLARHSVTAVGDVRSTPYSRLQPQFNREPLRAALKAAGISYVFLGEELGARVKDASCRRNGKADYDLIAQTAAFRAGLDRVRKGAESHVLALMCAEKDPLECHRTILVARRLVELGMQVVHVLFDGETENHEQSVSRLLAETKMAEDDFFRSRAEAVADAYRLRGEAIAHIEDDHSSDAETRDRRLVNSR